MRRPGLEDRCRIRPGLAGYRRSGLSLPTTNLLLQLDARVGVTEGATFTWADQSGNGNDATQGTGANQPSVETNVTLGTVVRFDDANTEFLDLDGLALAGGEYTIYAVVDPTDSGNQDFLISWGTSGIGFAFRQFNSTFAGMFNGTLYRCSHVGVDGPQVLRVTLSGSNTSSAVHRNSVSAATDTWANVTDDGATVRLGIAYTENAVGAAEMDLAFLAVYQDAHDTDQAAAVEAYLAQEWPLS